MQYKFMEPVNTPKGEGLYIAQMTDGVSCQVAIREHGIQKNPIFHLDEISRIDEPKRTRQPRPQPATVSQVADVALQDGVTTCYTPEI